MTSPRRILPRTPFDRGAPWNFKTQYEIVNWCVSAVWVLRLASPAAWILSAFQVQDNTGRYHAAARPTELYVLLTHGICTLIFLALAPITWLSSWIATVAAALLITEICQYHFHLMILRPAIDRGYVQYNFARTLILTLLSYQGLITLFAIIYLGRFESSFSITRLGRASAWSLSAGILTGTGYSGISPKPGSIAAVVGGAESVLGILFLTAILGLVLSRVSARALDVAVTRSPRLIDPQEIRRAIQRAGQMGAIDRIQTALQADVWVTGGWLRSYALGQYDYNGDIDLLVDGLSHDALAQRLEAAGIRFSRSRLRGFRFEPAPGIKIDCFSTSAFGPAVSVQESFGYFNATVNAAAFKFSDPSTFFVHPLFEADATKRLLRVLPDGLSLQTERDRARSLVGTLHLLTREHLSLVPDESTRRLIRSVAADQSFVHGCEFICRLLDQENRYHEAALIRGWMT